MTSQVKFILLLDKLVGIYTAFSPQAADFIVREFNETLRQALKEQPYQQGSEETSR